MAQAITDLDPTGTLSAAGAAVNLVGAALRTVPAFQNAANAMRSQSGSNKGPEILHRAQTSSEAPALGVDSSREKRAYETVNFVLRELGSRVCAAGLVNEHALEKALTAATQHVEINLFSGETNRLFASLAPKLSDPILVNAVFTSIYLIGALTAELSRSLPNYKESYPPLGPWIVQQLFRTAIGEDAFRENLTANLDAYKTVASTAGLLRPTDIGYSSFPGFPAFSATRYSSRSFGDVRNHKSVYDKLVKHFDKFGFPQPIIQKQGDVGLIRDWRFLAGDSPSRHYDIEKADKNIGETFGRVLHWLICSADRLPYGQAVIAYYLQHTELIKWIGQRMGYSILYGAADFDMSDAHSKLDKYCRSVFNTWVILMPSERARATRRASSASWAQTHVAAAAQASSMQSLQPQAIQSQRNLSEAHRNAEDAPIVVPIVQPQALAYQASLPQTPQTQGLPAQVQQSSPSSGQTPLFQSQAGPMRQLVPQSSAPSATLPPPKTIDEKLDDVSRDFNANFVPQCERFLSMPPTDPNSRLSEYRGLTQHIEKSVIGWLDELPIPEAHPARMRRKEMIFEAQQLLKSLDVANMPPSVADTPSIAKTLSVANLPPAVISGSNVATPSHLTASPIEKPSVSTPTASPNLSPSQQALAVFSASPPPYSPNTPPSIVSAGSISNSASYPFPTKKPVRRKAPPPPKKFLAAKAMYDFEPEEDNDEELAFKEGDDIEIIEKTPALEEEGWCRARLKGQKKLGLVPLEYLEIVEKPPTLQPTAPTASLSAPAVPAVETVQHELHGGESQTYHDTSTANHTSVTTPIDSAMYAPSSQPSHPVGYPSTYPSPYPNDPYSSTANSQNPHQKSKFSKMMEVAKFAVAATGAATTIATYVEQKNSSDDWPASDASQQEPLTQNAAVNEQNDPAQSVQNNYNTTNLTQNNDNPTNIIQNNNTGLAAPASPPLNLVTDAPPVVDLSAYGSSPFDPQFQLDGPNSVAAADPFSMAQTPAQVPPPDIVSAPVATSVPHDMSVCSSSPVLAATSPFAGMVTSVPIVDISDATVQLGTDDVDDDVDDDVFYRDDY